MNLLTGSSLLALAKSILEFIHSTGWGGGERLLEFDWEEEGLGAY